MKSTQVREKWDSHAWNGSCRRCFLLGSTNNTTATTTLHYLSHSENTEKMLKKCLSSLKLETQVVLSTPNTKTAFYYHYTVKYTSFANISITLGQVRLFGTCWQINLSFFFYAKMYCHQPLHENDILL